MTEKKTTKSKPKIKGVKLTVSNDQRTVTSEQIEMDNDDMVIIMPKYQPMTFKKRLYWIASILYRHWN